MTQKQELERELSRTWRYPVRRETFQKISVFFEPIYPEADEFVVAELLRGRDSVDLNSQKKENEEF